LTLTALADTEDRDRINYLTLILPAEVGGLDNGLLRGESLQADDVAAIAGNVPRRFARLQRKHGRWRLAYLESLLRAADYAAGADPSAFVEKVQ
jgi:hypothetical protein